MGNNEIDPFLKGNEEIEQKILDYYMDRDEEHLIAVLETIRERMHGDGHFIVPIEVSQDDPSLFAFRGLQLQDGGFWYVAFTTEEEFTRGASSEVLSNFIDMTLKACLEAPDEIKGILINPWGQPFLLSRDLIKDIMDADNGLEYIVPSDPVTPEMLKDGSYLKKAIEICNRNQTQGNAIRLFRIMRECSVWIAIAPENGENEVNGKDISAFMLPDMLNIGEEFAFPVFTSPDEMGEYGDRFGSAKVPFLKALKMAEENGHDLTGIVVNAFSEPFVINKKAFAFIEELDSSLAKLNDEEEK